jgi:hypothetical protein
MQVPVSLGILASAVITAVWSNDRRASNSPERDCRNVLCHVSPQERIHQGYIWRERRPWNRSSTSNPHSWIRPAQPLPLCQEADWGPQDKGSDGSGPKADADSQWATAFRCKLRWSDLRWRKVSWSLSESKWCELNLSDYRWGEVKWSEVTCGDVRWGEVFLSDFKWREVTWSKFKWFGVT